MYKMGKKIEQEVILSIFFRYICRHSEWGSYSGRNSQLVECHLFKVDSVC